MSLLEPVLKGQKAQQDLLHSHQPHILTVQRLRLPMSHLAASIWQPPRPPAQQRACSCCRPSGRVRPSRRSAPPSELMHVSSLSRVTVIGGTRLAVHAGMLECVSDILSQCRMNAKAR